MVGEETIMAADYQIMFESIRGLVGRYGMRRTLLVLATLADEKAEACLTISNKKVDILADREDEYRMWCDINLQLLMLADKFVWED